MTRPHAPALLLTLMALWAWPATAGEAEKPEAPATQKPATALDYSIDLTTIYPPLESKGSWFQPRPVAIPGHGDSGKPLVIMTIQKALGSDFFTGLGVARTSDFGLTWTPPKELPELGWRLAENNLDVGLCDFTLGWHAPTKKVIGIGHTARYTKKGFAGYGHPRDTTYSVYDPEKDSWTPWAIFEFPKTKNNKYFFNGTHGQWLTEPDGTLLVPVYFVAKGKDFLAKGTVVRCAFDGATLRYVEHGDELLHPVKRGLYEKSLTFYKGRYYMTMRNDKKGFLAVSDDGLHFGPIKAWTFDDGSDLGSYNTQQKWVTHSDALYLVYTRRGANNDHIIRHRAPLFIARVDTEQLCVLRETERIAAPEAGRALGNFDATTINAHETWITVAGGAAYCARLRWSKPNQLAGRVN